MTLIVDPNVAFSGSARVTADVNSLQAVKAAYTQAAERVNAAGREVLLIEVLVRVAPQPLDFDSDAPLKSCAFGADIESCDSCQ